MSTPFAPNWNTAPKWAQWFAIDSDGYAYWWLADPKPSRSRWSGDGSIRSQIASLSRVDMTNINWKETLRKRP